MTDAIMMPGCFVDYRPLRRARRSPARGLGLFTVAFTVLSGTWLWDTRPVAVPPAVRYATAAASRAYDGLLDPAFSLGLAPARLGESLPLQSAFESPAPTPNAIAPVQAAEADIPLPPAAPTAEVAQLVESVPLPTPRPQELRPAPTPASVRTSGRQLAMRTSAASAVAPVDNRGFFEKIFGGLEAPSPTPAGPVMAYAAPEDGAFGRLSVSSAPMVARDQGTAVYDISAHTVYMPDGSRLEAHSGLGDRLDDPRHVSERMRGATPPHTYELTPREQLFHGVKALRLTPVGGSGNVYGRTGLLAHTFMLGPNGDSNGCVSFRNYNAFLQAYMSGQVKRLVVVARQG